MGEASKDKSSGPGTAVDVDLIAEQFDVVDDDTRKQALLEAIRCRDAYRKLIGDLQDELEKLKRGLVGPKSYRFKGEDNSQLSLAVLAELLGLQDPEGADAKELAAQLVEQAEADTQDAAAPGDEGQDGDVEPGQGGAHRKPHKTTGRKAAKELPEIEIEVLPDEVKRLGTDAFERIGEESSTTIERRVSSLVKVTVVRPKFRAKTPEAETAIQQARADSGVMPEVPPQAWITVAPPPELPIERGMAGPGLLANVIVRRFDDHLPYNRLQNVYEREGMRLGRSTLYGWLDAARPAFSPLIKAMLADAKRAPYLCTDATGVLVQAPEKCSRGHFWVVVVPGRHVLFAFSRKHDAAAIDKLLGDYDGHVVADAHSVYDHLYGDEGATEVACWGHARAYFFKTLASEPEIAQEVLGNLRVMFLLERKFADKPRKQRERLRATKVKVLVERHFELCRKHETTALEDTPLHAAIRYSLNQEQALRRFLSDGRLPATNNISERQLRRQATGRNNWLFIGSGDGAKVNTTFATLVASCHMNDIEPEAYLRDLLCLLPCWPKSRILELAPCNWKKTRQQPDTQQRLAANPFRNAVLELDTVHPQPR